MKQKNELSHGGNLSTAHRGLCLEFFRDCRGAAIAEFSVVLFFTIPFFMALIEASLILNEWRRVNDLVEAQVLYIGASTSSRPSNAQQLYASSSSSATTITAAVAEINSRIRAAHATPNVTLGCGCPSGTGASATITLSRSLNSSPPYCPPPPDMTCGTGLGWSAYADVAATKNHVVTFVNLGWLVPPIRAHALARIY